MVRGRPSWALYSHAEGWLAATSLREAQVVRVNHGRRAVDLVYLDKAEPVREVRVAGSASSRTARLEMRAVIHASLVRGRRANHRFVAVCARGRHDLLRRLRCKQGTRAQHRLDRQGLAFGTAQQGPLNSRAPDLGAVTGAAHAPTPWEVTLPSRSWASSRSSALLAFACSQINVIWTPRLIPNQKSARFRGYSIDLKYES